MRFLYGLLALIFLGSCASKGPIFLKRRYSQGYYANFGSHKHAKTNDQASSVKEKIHDKTDLVIVSAGVVAKAALDPKKIPLVSAFKKKPHTGILGKGGQTVLAHSDKVGAVRTFVPKSIAIVKKPTQNLGFIPILEGPGVAILMFILCSLIYTLCLLAKNPDMGLGAAIIIGMLGALITICTGVIFC